MNAISTKLLSLKMPYFSIIQVFSPLGIITSSWMVKPLLLVPAGVYVCVDRGDGRLLDGGEEI
jgi:hypothetical protein